MFSLAYFVKKLALYCYSRQTFENLVFTVVTLKLVNTTKPRGM